MKIEDAIKRIEDLEESQYQNLRDTNKILVNMALREDKLRLEFNELKIKQFKTNKSLSEFDDDQLVEEIRRRLPKRP